MAKSFISVSESSSQFPVSEEENIHIKDAGIREMWLFFLQKQLIDEQNSLGLI